MELFLCAFDRPPLPGFMTRNRTASALYTTCVKTSANAARSSAEGCSSEGAALRRSQASSPVGPLAFSSSIPYTVPSGARSVLSSSLMRRVSTSARFSLSRMYATFCRESYVILIQHHPSAEGSHHSQVPG